MRRGTLPISDFAISPTRRRYFPGAPGLVGAARKWVVEQLPGGPDHPAAWTVRMVASEMITNAVEHSRSGGPDGVYAVAVHAGKSLVWVGVQDQGGGTLMRPGCPDEMATSGRGLFIVDQVALEWGSRIVADGRFTWAVIACDADQCPDPDSDSDSGPDPDRGAGAGEP